MPVTRTFDGTDWVPLTAAASGSGTVSHTDLINIESDSHHARYTNSEAVTAMGAKSTTNPLNHDRYTDANARTAVDNGTYLKLAGGTMTGTVGYLGPGGVGYFLEALNQAGGGAFNLGFFGATGTTARIRVGGNVPATNLFEIQGGGDTPWLSLSVNTLTLTQDINLYSTAQKSIRMRNGSGGSGHALTQKTTGRFSLYDYSESKDILEVIPSIGMQMFNQNQDSSVVRNITIATVGPTGGVNGDVWIVV